VQADSDSTDPDSASPPPESSDASDEPSTSGTSSDSKAGQEKGKKVKPELRKYIESFDQETMRETAKILSREGASLLDRQTRALWGDVKELQAEMQQVCPHCSDVWSWVHACIAKSHSII
jgi:hypothetical protein